MYVKDSKHQPSMKSGTLKQMNQYTSSDLNNSSGIFIVNNKTAVIDISDLICMFHLHIFRVDYFINISRLFCISLNKT